MCVCVCVCVCVYVILKLHWINKTIYFISVGMESEFLGPWFLCCVYSQLQIVLWIELESIKILKFIWRTLQIVPKFWETNWETIAHLRNGILLTSILFFLPFPFLLSLLPFFLFFLLPHPLHFPSFYSLLMFLLDEKWMVRIGRLEKIQIVNSVENLFFKLFFFFFPYIAWNQRKHFINFSSPLGSCFTSMILFLIR